MNNIAAIARLVAALVLLTIPIAAWAQDKDPAATPPAESAAPRDPFGRSTPAGTVAGFIDAISAKDYARAALYLDLSKVPERKRPGTGPTLARDLQRALDLAGDIYPAQRISNAPGGDPTDAPTPDIEAVGRLGMADTSPQLLLRRVEGEATPLWLFSAETLAAARQIAPGDVAVQAEAWLPGFFTERTLAGTPLAHWLTLIGLALAAFAVLMLAGWLLFVVLRRTGPRTARLQAFIRASSPLALLVAMGLAAFLAPRLGVSIIARHAYGWLFGLVTPLIVGWLAIKIVDAVSTRILLRFGQRSRATATAIVRFAARVVKVAIAALAVLALLDAFGFDVTGLIAALGIGGLAIALGAQKTVENLIASISIIFDRPFRVGDFCKVGDTVGTIEDVGMRSTRVRTLSRTMVTIPNSTLVASSIENFAPRDRFWFNPMLRISVQTKPETIRALLIALRATLDGDARLVDAKARIRLLAPTEDRLPIEIFGYVLAPDYDAFLATQEDLMLKLLDVVTAHGLTLAPPALELFPGPDAGRSAEPPPLPTTVIPGHA